MNNWPPRLCVAAFCLTGTAHLTGSYGTLVALPLHIEAAHCEADSTLNRRGLHSTIEPEKVINPDKDGRVFCVVFVI